MPYDTDNRSGITQTASESQRREKSKDFSRRCFWLKAL